MISRQGDCRGSCSGYVFCIAAGYSNIVLTAPTTGTYAKLAIVGLQVSTRTAGAILTEGGPAPDFRRLLPERPDRDEWRLDDGLRHRQVATDRLAHHPDRRHRGRLRVHRGDGQQQFVRRHQVTVVQ